MYKLKESQFIDWYFSDDEDYKYIGERVRKLLEESGDVTISLDNLFWEQDEIPTWILESYEGDDDYINADEVELIKD